MFTMAENEIIQGLNRQMEANFNEGISATELNEKLVDFINELIQNDFERLVFLLYRIDIDEVKLKTILKESEGKDTGVIIAGLILEREKQKVETRNKFRS